MLDILPIAVYDIVIANSNIGGDMKNLINVKVFENYMKENNLNKTQFCKLCGIGLSTFNKLITNNYKHLSTMVLCKIANATNITPNQMLNW